MKKIVAFGASNSSRSINQQLAQWASKQVMEVDVNLLDLNDFEMPIYSMDREQANGIPELAQKFKQTINEADGILISFAEHNGSYSSAFKNVLDWMSRLGRPIWSDKPLFLMGSSPGGRGASMVLETATKSFPHQGGKVSATFSLPSFNQNFNAEEGITDGQLKSEFEAQLANFEQAINKTETTANAT